MNRFDEQRVLFLWSGVSLRRRRILRRDFFDRYANFCLGTVFSRVSSGVQRAARMPFERSKEIVRLSQRQLIVDQRTCKMNAPTRFAKLLRALATGYLCMPFDLIPDFILRIGHLDDAVIFQHWFAALRFVPRELVSSIASRPLETKPFHCHDFGA